MVSETTTLLSDTEQSSEHLLSAFKHLGRLRRNSLFCDVILEAEDGQISAHKVILASRCSYFRAMFMCGTRESWATEVKLTGITLRTLDIVVGFIYNEKIRILGEFKVSVLVTLVLSSTFIVNFILSALYDRPQ